jgi:hypothetical protein
MRNITFGQTLQTSDVSTARLGEVAMTPDGREWVYVKANEAVSLGHALTRVANTDADTIASATDGDGNITLLTQASAGWTAGQFADAYGIVDAGTGSGQFFKVRTNTADTLQLYSDYALSTALSVSDSDIVLARPYLAEKTAVTVLHQIPLGVAQVAFAANEFGWALRRGIGTVIAGAALVANELCTPGDDTEGEVITVGSGETIDDASFFGRCVAANGSADEGAMIDANLL